MLKVEFTGQFKKDYKLAVKRGCDPKNWKKSAIYLHREIRFQRSTGIMGIMR